METYITMALTILMALFASWMLLQPFFAGGEADQRSFDDGDGRSHRKELTLRALEDLERDHLSEKVSEDDYREAKAELLGQAAKYYKNEEDS